MTDNDLIYKRTARRIIDSPRSREQMLAVLEGTPPIVEIIRCKDCKYHRQNDYGDSWCSHPKGLDQFDLKPTDFCSRAERRTDGTEQP